MSQSRLSILAILSFESQLARKLDNKDSMTSQAGRPDAEPLVSQARQGSMIIVKWHG